MTNLLLEIGTEDLPHTHAFVIKKLLEQTLKNLNDCVSLNYTKKIFVSHRRFVILLKNIIIKKNITDINDKTLHFSVSHNTQEHVLKQVLLRTSSIYTKDITVTITNKILKIFKKNTYQHLCIGSAILQKLKETLKNSNIEKKIFLGNTCCQFIRPLLHIILLVNKKKKFKFYNLTSNNITFKNRILTNKILTVTTKNYEKKLEKSGLVIPSLLKRIELCRRKISNLEKIHKVKTINSKILLTELCMCTEYPNVEFGLFDKKYLTNKPKLLLKNIILTEQHSFLTERTGNIQNIFFFLINTLHTKNKYIRKGHIITIDAKLNDQENYLKNITQQNFNDKIYYKKNKNTYILCSIIVLTKTITGKDNHKILTFLLNIINNTQNNVLQIHSTITYLYKTRPNNITKKIITLFQNLTILNDCNPVYKKQNICLTTLSVNLGTSVAILLVLFHEHHYNINNKDPFGIRTKIKNYSNIALFYKVNTKKIVNTIKILHNIYRKNVHKPKEFIKRILIYKKKEYNKKLNTLQTFNTIIKNNNCKIIQKILLSYKNTIKRVINILKQNKQKIQNTHKLNKNLIVECKIKLIKNKIFLFNKQKNYQNVTLEVLRLHTVYAFFLNTTNIYSYNKTKTKQHIFILKETINMFKLIQI